MKAVTSKTTNMTEGTPVRLIMTFAVPLLIGNIFQQVYSLVDTMIAGHFPGDRAIAAIGSTSVIYSLQAMGHKVLPVLSSTIELVVKIISAAVLVPALGYLGVAVTEPAIWCICAAFLCIFYVTVGHQKEKAI